MAPPPPSAATLPTAPPQASPIESSDPDAFYMRLMQYRFMNPAPIPFSPVLSYVSTLQFLSMP